MTIMKDRIKKIRKKIDLTQQEFADRIGIARGNVGAYEVGKNAPSDAVISLICREFDVNEQWLREGKGEMFLPNDRNSDIARLTKQLLNEEKDSFKNRFISMLANLTVSEWEFIEHKARELIEGAKTYHKEYSEDSATRQIKEKDESPQEASLPILNAAHADNYMEASEELRIQEEDIMDSEDF